ncbi:MAG TPA: hypothetical protein VHF22_02200, partial [Planctomycetota bacterium]|nr:hypothetical protein [Planctomycetota bacterium]
LAAAKALEARWARLVDAADEAWEEVKTKDIGADVERTILAIVSKGENVLLIPDPAAFVEKLEKEVREARRKVGRARAALEAAHGEMVADAEKASAIAAQSPSSWVRDAATVRVPSGAETGRPPGELLARRARRDLEALVAEAENLAEQLADVVKNQAALAVQLADQTRRLAAKIAELQRASRLPRGLDAWSEKEFLAVDLPLPEDDGDLARSLERTLAAWAEADRLPPARDLLPQALVRSLIAPPRVLIPKADRFDVWPPRRPIQQISKDSGGEALTVAFILFCVMARVAAGGRRGEDRVTLALIDNPLGTANKFDFVDAQCRVAAAFSVQYIAASGIPDPQALERFERLITLTNPSQRRVKRESVDDPLPGRPVERVLFAREEVLEAGGAPRRTGGGADAP